MSNLPPIYRTALVRESTEHYGDISNAKDAATIARQLISDCPQELLLCMALTVKGRVIGASVIHKGTLSASMVSTRDVFAFALLANAASIIVAHNHPSGDHTPSPADHAITNRIREAGKLLDVKLLDHIVIGDTEHYSFAAEGKI